MINYYYLRKKVGNKYYYLPKKIAHNCLFKDKFGKKINWNNPQNFNEKLHWLIAIKYGKKEAYYADKFSVREYIAKCGFKDNLTKIYGVWTDVSKINLTLLPNKFVLKTNHGCGSDYYIVCKDKKTINWEKEIKKLELSLKINYAKAHCEYHYKYIKPIIFAEELLEEKGLNCPLDYKLYSFHGKVKMILVCTDRDTGTKYNYYDKDWNYLDITKDEYKSNMHINKPENLNKLIEMAEIISKPFDFARIDLYCINNKIYFSEITFSPSGGDESDFTDEAQKWLGSLLHIKGE